MSTIIELKAFPLISVDMWQIFAVAALCKKHITIHISEILTEDFPSGPAGETVLSLSSLTRFKGSGLKPCTGESGTPKQRPPAELLFCQRPVSTGRGKGDGIFEQTTKKRRTQGKKNSE